MAEAAEAVLECAFIAILFNEELALWMGIDPNSS